MQEINKLNQQQAPEIVLYAQSQVVESVAEGDTMPIDIMTLGKTAHEILLELAK